MTGLIPGRDCQLPPGLSPSTARVRPLVASLLGARARPDDVVRIVKNRRKRRSGQTIAIVNIVNNKASIKTGQVSNLIYCAIPRKRSHCEQQRNQEPGFLGGACESIL
jgi:hypothetical protein